MTPNGDSILLLIVTLLPLAGALVLCWVPKTEEHLHKGFGIAVTLTTFLVSLWLITEGKPEALALGDWHPAVWSATLDWTWVASLGIHFKLGVDGISLFLVVLTTFLMPIVFLSAWNAIDKKVREFCICLLVLETGMLGAFLSLDLFVFYVFWELMLIPMYIIIGVWGGDRRMMASVKFVLYTLVGSLLMLVAILYMYYKQHDASGVWTFDYDAFRRLVLTDREQMFLFFAFALAFAIKVPLWPLHTWLPDAHVEAPTAGSVILAGVLLKFGTYGLIRFAIPFFPHAMGVFAPYMAIMGVIGVIYGSLVAWAQTDVKKLIAYSSVAHLGLCVTAICSWTGKGIDGAMLIMLAHGISTSGLFLAIGVIYERRHTRKIDEFGGVWAVMPKFAAAFLFMTLASIGLPALSGFPGEFLSLLGTFDGYRTWVGLPVFIPHPKLVGTFATTGVILGAVYMLWMYQKTMFGPNLNPKNQSLRDMSAREITVFVPMIVAALWLGLRPATFLDRIDPAVNHTMQQFREKYIAGPETGPKPHLLNEAPPHQPGSPMPMPPPTGIGAPGTMIPSPGGMR